jgi:hypothetical protein
MRIIALLAFVIASFLAASAIAGGVPQGSYLQSCSGASVSGDVLSADCEYGGKSGSVLPIPKPAEAPNVNHTTLNHVSRCIGDIANTYGRLQCRRWSTAPTQPTQQQSQQQLPDWSAVDKKQNYCENHCVCCKTGTCAIDPASYCPSKSASVDPTGYWGCFNSCMHTF